MRRAMTRSSFRCMRCRALGHAPDDARCRCRDSDNREPAPSSAGARAMRCKPAAGGAVRDAAAAPRARSRRAGTVRSARAVSTAPIERAARDRLRRRRASDRARRERNPRTGFIGIEPFVNGMAKALAAIDGAELAQHPAASRRRDRCARLAAATPRSRASTCSIPIPGRSGGTGSGASCRTRASRRSRAILRPGGEFRFATDIPDYAAWTLVRLLRSPGFRMDRRDAPTIGG